MKFLLTLHSTTAYSVITNKFFTAKNNDKYTYEERDRLANDLFHDFNLMVCPDGCRRPERHCKGSHKDWHTQTFNTLCAATGLFYNINKKNYAYGKNTKIRRTI